MQPRTMPGCHQLYATPVPTRFAPQNRGFSPSFPAQARSDVTKIVTRPPNPAAANCHIDKKRHPASRRLQTPCQPGGPDPPHPGVTASSVPTPSDLTPRSGGWGGSVGSRGVAIAYLYRVSHQHARTTLTPFSLTTLTHPWDSQRKIRKSPDFEPIGVSGSIPGGFAGWVEASAGRGT